MDFDFGEDQEILRKTAREFLNAECPAQLVRAVEETEAGYSAELWRKMADLGWPGLTVGEEYGGVAGSFIDLAILAEEIGRVLAPVPFIPAVLCGYALTKAGNDEQKRTFLPPMVSGKTLVAIASNDLTLFGNPSGVETEAVKKGDEYVISGRKSLVPYGASANGYLIAARTGSRGDKRISLFMVERNSPGIETALVRTIGSDAQCQLLMKDVRVSGNRLLGGEGEGQAVLKDLLHRGALLKCAEMVGGAQWVVEKTVEYVKERVQFDRPIGTFQAIQHKCANMAIACDGARFITYQAAWRQSEGLPSERDVAMAKAWVSDAYTRICLESHQAHGAIGFTKEYDLQLYTRRAKAAELAFGDSRFHYEAVAGLMGLDGAKSS
ncbi:MAG: acyl-CoA/acyl-ACP dehydrogenase [Deltaproteobacteria bacterium]|nr:acyl-CoA/acyl-ACP dehydrogenase [Deltaproteobacteria bacterium]